MNRRKEGLHFEKKAEQYLIKKGYELITKNFQYNHCEIDLIVLSPNNILVFVEVKYRQNNKYFNPLDSITKKKQENIIFASKGFLEKNEKFFDFFSRYDIILIVNKDEKINIFHLENAFIEDN